MTLSDLRTHFPLPSRLAIYGLLLVALVFGAGVVKDWYLPSTDGPSLTYQRRPLTLRASREIKDAPKVVVTTKVETVAPRPRVRRKIEKKFGLDLDTTKLLTEAQVPKAPSGGSVAVTLDPAGHTTVTFVPDRPHFFDLGGPFEVGGGPVLTTAGRGFRVFAAKDLGRVAYFTFKLEGDLDVVNGQNRGSVGLFVVYRH